MSRFLDVLASRLNWNEETKNKAAQLITEPSDKESDEYKSYLKGIEEIVPQLERLGTRDYFINDTETIKTVKNRVTADLYDGVETKSQSVFDSIFGNEVGEGSFNSIFKDKSLKFADKQAKALELLRDNFKMKEQSFKKETPENFQKALEEKDSVINQLRSDIDTTKSNFEKELQKKGREFELELIKGDLKGYLNQLPLADRERQSDLAFMKAYNDLSSNFHLKRGEKNGEIKLFQKEDPTLPANDEETKTSLDIKKFITKSLGEAGLLSRNNGNPNPGVNNGASKKLPDGEKIHALPAGVHPESEAAKRFNKMKSFNMTGGRVITE